MLHICLKLLYLSHAHFISSKLLSLTYMVDVAYLFATFIKNVPIQMFDNKFAGSVYLIHQLIFKLFRM